jgi:hypothetical protein
MPSPDTDQPSPRPDPNAAASPTFDLLAEYLEMRRSTIEDELAAYADPREALGLLQEHEIVVALCQKLMGLIAMAAAVANPTRH